MMTTINHFKRLILIARYYNWGEQPSGGKLLFWEVALMPFSFSAPSPFTLLLFSHFLRWLSLLCNGVCPNDLGLLGPADAKVGNSHIFIILNLYLDLYLNTIPIITRHILKFFVILNKYVIRLDTFSFVWNMYKYDIKMYWQHWSKIDTANFTIFSVFHLVIQNCVNCMKCDFHHQLLGGNNSWVQRTKPRRPIEPRPRDCRLQLAWAPAGLPWQGYLVTL